MQDGQFLYALLNNRFLASSIVAGQLFLAAASIFLSANDEPYYVLVRRDAIEQIGLACAAAAVAVISGVTLITLVSFGRLGTVWLIVVATNVIELNYLLRLPDAYISDLAAYSRATERCGTVSEPCKR